MSVLTSYGLKLSVSSKPYEPDLRYAQGRPFYFVAGRWEPFDVASYQTRGDRPTLELWSGAHRALFLQQADLLAQPMSFGNETAFCGGQRCAIALEGRAELKQQLTPYYGTQI